ncbi:MAG: hypothetical protein IKF38_07420 [Clostridia bacterium]|nr:hypothetical protein [Clostridia bacterium]
MDDNAISQMLAIVLAILIFILFLLCIIYFVIRLKEKSKNTVKANKNPYINTQEKDTKKEKKSTSSSAYIKQSIFDFMEFENVQDNMIIQKKGKRYLIVVECQGVNYDLMSKMEKNAVEEGFQQFLNTLRHPIQIYIQTRTMNLEKSIQSYKERLKTVEDRYNRVQREYNMMRENPRYSEEDIKKEYYELTKSRNLLEYGKDIINNTERMSLNKNVLTKKYYIVIPYYSEEDSNYSIEEIRNMAFSELYTKAQSIISTLSACSVSGKILNSTELIELLYMAYNREEADTYGIERALKAEYDSLYSTAPDVYEKKIKVLDEEIEEAAIELANKKINEIKSRPQQQAEEKEESLEDLVNKMAQMILGDNKSYVGKKVAEEAIKELEEERKAKEGGEDDVQFKEKTKRTRRKN